MQITFIGHASILVEACGVSVLSDPWWRGPCFGAQWWNYPAPYLQALEGRRVDYIYISHGHPDHFHHGTLRTLPRDAKVVVSRKTKLRPFIQELGFDVLELDDDDEVALGNGGLICRVMETHAQDTLMALCDGHEVCLNLNDALHAAPEAVQVKFVAKLKRLFPAIDYVFCGYGTASHFPNCYVIPGKDRQATAARRQQYFNRQWAKLIAQLNPRFGFPFAADVVFLEEDLFWANEPTHNSERPTDTFRALYPNSPVSVIDIAPGFTIRDGQVAREVLREPFVAAQLKSRLAEEIDRASRLGGAADEAEVKEVAALVEQSLRVCAEYLQTYDENYRFLIRFRCSGFGISIEKRGRDLQLRTVPVGGEYLTQYDVVYTTRLPYLKWSFSRPYGDEILFVGSGGIFQYADRAKARQNLHRELMQLLTRREQAPRPRYGSSSKLIHNAKQILKKCIGRPDQDLYDLEKWTVFGGERT